MKPAVHGRYATYAAGCRCTACVTYQRERVARSRQERLASQRLNHGTRSAYDCGCRCTDCLLARSRAYATELQQAARAAEIRRTAS